MTPIKKYRSKVRRQFRRQQRQAAVATQQTEKQFERYFFGRLEKFSKVWRFMTGWIVLLVLLIGCMVAQNLALSGYYQQLKPIPGGLFSEGIVGEFTNANPIYATNNVDLSVSHLIFAGLFKYNDRNQLIGDLAQSWRVDPTGETYTVVLRPHLVWQDGRPLTAADVAYTYHTIQNPDAESPLQASWSGINVAATNSRTIVFTLPNPLSSFIYTLTNGIVPQHLLKDVPMTELRSSLFNTNNPIGAGPFMWHDIQISGDDPSHAEEQLSLVPFEHYWAGAPKLHSFILQAFAQQSSMLSAYRQKQLTAMAGLATIPADIAADTHTNQYNFTLTAEKMIFFRTTAGVLSDVAVRQALVQAADPAAIIAKLGHQAVPAREPVLSSQFAYDSKYAQTTANLPQAKQTLLADGWIADSGGLLTKNGQPLSFTLTAADTAEARLVSTQLQQQWRLLGVHVTIQLEDDNSFRTTLSSHNYEAVLYGISIGPDPDVFVYWDSSQADIRSVNRLNLSEYNNPAADLALEAGRTRTGDALRKIKYQPFLQAWQADAPGLALYQPRFTYVSHEPIYGLAAHPINAGTDRYGNVSNWMIRTAEVTDN
jgi:peptide/nickel transport system substrate-binding protein